MQIIQLDNLINIIDAIVAEDDPTLFNESTIIEFTETVMQLIDEYILNNPTFISDPDFHEELKEIIMELTCVPFEMEFFWNSELKEEMETIIEEIMDIYFLSLIPYRSYPSSIILNQPNYEFVNKQIDYLRSLPQPEQRTKEWYEFRNNLITASNAYKAFENENTRNQLIYEKCNIKKHDNNDDLIGEETKTINIQTNTSNYVNVNTTLHWGQKYEKVSVMIYEHKYNTTIEDFGCIQHDKYKFIGASPDGINVDNKSMRYGRMLEIKNIINREIDGIPKKEYWIQMQLQMEVCNLDECDFLETKFIEYESYLDYCNDNECEMKGLIMYFAKQDGSPFYVYKPIDMLDSEQWEEENNEKCNKLSMTWIKNCYWKLEKLSCVLVLRNKQWFKENISVLRDIWTIIETERKTGFDHRCPNKRIKKDSLLTTGLGSGSVSSGCFLKINKENDKINIDQTTNVNVLQKSIHHFFTTNNLELK
jgi:putative phage-type endonuclease